MPSDVDAKREAAIAKKEAERKAKNDAIAAEKKAKADERNAEKAAKDKEASDEAAKKEELQKKRDEKIAEKEAARGGKKKQSSKYSKKEILELKAVFDEYDHDKSGQISVDEFSKALRKKKEASAPRAGEKSTREQRQAAEGVSIADLSETVFHAMDADNSGEVTFEEMLKLTYKYATPAEIDIMLGWVRPPTPPPPEPEPEMSAEAKKMIKDIFKLCALTPSRFLFIAHMAPMLTPRHTQYDFLPHRYDKDKSGSLSLQELKKALANTGLDPEEIEGYFKDYDTDGNKEISQGEFHELMKSTGAFDD